MSHRKPPEERKLSRSISATDAAWERYQSAAESAGVPFADWLRASLDAAAARQEAKQSRKGGAK